MTFLEAVYQVLADAGGPLSQSAIWSEIEAAGLVETKGKTPERTLSVQLGRACLNTGLSSAHSKPTLFRTEDGRYRLLSTLSDEERAGLVARRNPGSSSSRFGWNKKLWSLIEAGAEEKGIEPVFRVQRRGEPELEVTAVLVDGKPHARIDEALRRQLDRVDEPVLLERLKNEGDRKGWSAFARAIRDPRTKTRPLTQVFRCVFVPLSSPNRTSLNLNINLQLVYRDEMLQLLPEAESELIVAADLPELCEINDIGDVLGLREVDESPKDESEEATEIEERSIWEDHHNVIFFGPPGTGKSYTVARIVRETLDAEVHRLTFHPEYSYFDFVGTYRPCVGWLETTSQFTDASGSSCRREPRVYYGFEPGPFSRALVAAARQPSKNIVVIIEEINRGNCAAIFGDVFQLLDRAESVGREHGVSEYAIVPSSEWATWLQGEISETCEAWDGRSLRLPRNLYLYATMNTSDQSLFPMDTAFRRRWAMSYRSITAPPALKTRVPVHRADEVGMPWTEFAGPINKEIVAHMGSDDKQMGPYFVRPQPGTHVVTPLEFSSKVLFYLWSEVFRDAPNRIFVDGISTYDELVAEFEAAREVFRPELFGLVSESDEPGDEA